MSIRDQIEDVLRGWDAYERARGTTPVIDYDFAPATPDEVAPIGSRLEAYTRLGELRTDDPVLTSRLASDLAYLRALLGERAPLDGYLRDTQGCGGHGWSDEQIAAAGNTAREHLADLGIGWDAATIDLLEHQEGQLPVDDAPDAIRAAAAEHEAAMRELVGTDAPFHLTVETTEVDAYWAYWLDGVRSEARLRLNLRKARFTEVMARQFALHEILGHALQGASLSHVAGGADVPWVRILSVHAPQSTLFEGLAQALPLFLTPEDKPLIARVRLTHYLQLVRAELHLAVNAGTPITECAAIARSRVPFWNDEAIGDNLADRSVDPLLRSYLWSYPAGVDWFVALADQAPELGRTVLREAYRAPLSPAELTALWPAGPRIGG
ncbi:hypothetical protein F4553_007476 [Allocatelliglobosispora scoriae]|uniref:DUF885 domain-containing protein n=1 Tax=Allocatelliglobosispora scoriae TaxID=643052 RepID=A0A841C4Q1_9ACTN|nr:hypothetical protein [Allocatelliglobosispora scoriae]MBB5874042.1 hypothetical protein [Allocatelliglobosispora scoriae]